MRNSPLWRSMEPYLRDDVEKALLLEALTVAKAALDGQLREQKGELGAAMIWSTTPQGHGFWRQWNNTILQRKQEERNRPAVAEPAPQADKKQAARRNRYAVRIPAN